VQPAVRVHAPARAHEPEHHETEAAPREEEVASFHISSMMLMVGLGVLIIVFATIWGIAFQMGQTKRDRELGDLGGWKQPDGANAPGGSGTPGAASGPDTKPAPPVGPKPEGSGNTPKKPDAPKPESPAGTDPRVPGFNYLYMGTLTLKDASSGVEFLKRNSLQAFYVVDRSRGGGNNPPCRIYASQGYPGGPRFKETEKERADLVRRVEELGKKWQREEKGASDFRQPYWTLHKE